MTFVSKKIVTTLLLKVATITNLLVQLKEHVEQKYTGLTYIFTAATLQVCEKNKPQRGKPTPECITKF